MAEREGEEILRRRPHVDIVCGTRRFPEIPRFVRRVTERGERVVVMGATSGDTGSAAIEGCRHCNNIDIFILHPHKKVSPVQELQMTTVTDANVFNLAIKGTFDDGQQIIGNPLLLAVVQGRLGAAEFFPSRSNASGLENQDVDF